MFKQAFLFRLLCHEIIFYAQWNAASERDVKSNDYQFVPNNAKKTHDGSTISVDPLRNQLSKLASKKNQFKWNTTRKATNMCSVSTNPFQQPDERDCEAMRRVDMWLSE